MNASTHYVIPKEPGGAGALLLALFVHVALLGFLWIGVSWQSHEPAGVEAEIWDVRYREAAPPAPPERNEVVPPKPSASPVPEAARPDIALKQKRAKKRAEEDAARIKAEQKKAAAEKKKREAEAKRQREVAEQRMIARQRQENLRRLTAVAGQGDRGTAVRSTGNNRLDAAYADRIAAKIRSNTFFDVPENLDGNPAVEYAIELLPDGTLRGEPEKISSSGVPGFDEAALRAIRRSEPFPRDSLGKVPRSMLIKHRPKEKIRPD